MLKNISRPPWRFHPAGITTRTIHKLYTKHLEGHTLRDHVLVSQSQVGNLCDIFMSNRYRCIGESKLPLESFSRYRVARSYYLWTNT